MDDLTDFTLNEEYECLQAIDDKLAEIDYYWKPSRLILQCIDRISFRKFQGFPEYVPGSTNVWSFRKRIVDNGREKEIWNAEAT